MPFKMNASIFLVTVAVLFQFVNSAVDPDPGPEPQRPVDDPIDYCRTNGNTKNGYITVHIKHAVNATCMDICNQQREPDAQVILYKCKYDNNGNPKWNQRFECLAGNKKDTARFRVFDHKNSNCIFTGGSPNAPLYTIKCDNNSKQAHMSWRFLPVSSGNKRIQLKHDANGRCLKPEIKKTSKWGIIEVDCDEKDEMQHWVICDPFDRNCR